MDFVRDISLIDTPFFLNYSPAEYRRRLLLLEARRFQQEHPPRRLSLFAA